jgi:hypothetical protein
MDSGLWAGKSTVAAALVAIVVVLVSSFLVQTNVVAIGNLEAGEFHSASTKTSSLPNAIQPGCYAGTLNPYTIVEVPCMTNLPLGGSPIPSHSPIANVSNSTTNT